MTFNAIDLIACILRYHLPPDALPMTLTMPRGSTGLMLTVLLHLALLYALLRPTAVPPAVKPRRVQAPIQWLRLLPLPRTASLPATPSTSHASAKPKASAAAPSMTRSESISVLTKQAANKPPNDVAKEAASETAKEPPTPDLTMPAAAPRSVGDILQQAKRDLAGIDRELRKEHPDRGVALRPDSIQAKLERGFEAAHAAVLPKWYEAATMEEITGADNRTRIYRVKTALGMFCIAIADDGKKNYTTCPQ